MTETKPEQMAYIGRINFRLRVTRVKSYIEELIMLKNIYRAFFTNTNASTYKKITFLKNKDFDINKGAIDFMLNKNITIVSTYIDLLGSVGIKDNIIKNPTLCQLIVNHRQELNNMAIDKHYDLVMKHLDNFTIPYKRDEYLIKILNEFYNCAYYTKLGKIIVNKNVVNLELTVKSRIDYMMNSECRARLGIWYPDI